MAASLPVLLDISRTVSRAGRGPDTGIDRVERAYIRWASARSGSAFLCRMGRKAALIEGGKSAALFEGLGSVEAERLWPLAKVLAGRNPRDRRAERIVGRLARAVAAVEALTPSLRRAFPDGFIYINVGHTHLQSARLAALKQAGAAQVVVMIHDVIPLTHADTQTPKSVARFRDRLQAAGAEATLLLTSAEATARTIRDFVPDGAPEIAALPLGVEPAQDAPAHRQERPYFVQLGTVEPRKNTGLLLDIWPRLPEPRPQLQVIGRQGWLCDGIMRRIAEQSADVVHLGGLTDKEITARLKGAEALLFPSFAEGFGFPLFEAIQLKKHVLAADLPVFRELMPDGPLYLPPDDASTWFQQIEQRGSRSVDRRADNSVAMADVPRWSTHFDRLENLLTSRATAPEQ